MLQRSLIQALLALLLGGGIKASCYSWLQLQDAPMLGEVAPRALYRRAPVSYGAARVNAIAAEPTFGVYSLY
jgi:hypothetical protein